MAKIARHKQRHGRRYAWRIDGSGNRTTHVIGFLPGNADVDRHLVRRVNAHDRSLFRRRHTGVIHWDVAEFLDRRISARTERHGHAARSLAVSDHVVVTWHQIENAILAAIIGLAARHSPRLIPSGVHLQRLHRAPHHRIAICIHYPAMDNAHLLDSET